MFSNDLHEFWIKDESDGYVYKIVIKHVDRAWSVTASGGNVVEGGITGSVELHFVTEASKR